MDEYYEQAYQAGMDEAEKHLVDPSVISSINDEHIEEIHRIQDDCRKQYEELEAQLSAKDKELEEARAENRLMLKMLKLLEDNFPEINEAFDKILTLPTTTEE